MKIVPEICIDLEHFDEYHWLGSGMINVSSTSLYSVVYDNILEIIIPLIASSHSYLTSLNISWKELIVFLSSSFI